MIGRRDLLRIACSGAAALLEGKLFALGSSELGRPTNRYIIDGNLIPPIDGKRPMPEIIANQVRSSGLTAVKLTLAGSGSLNKAGTQEQLRVFQRNIALNPNIYLKVRSLADLERATASGRVGIIFSFEAAAMLEGAIENIDYFRAKDILIMGLSYNNQSPFASGTLVTQSTGLTSLGHQAIARMNAVGVTVDLSHSDERSSREAIEASSKPSLITHAGCSAIYNHPRNKSDDLLHNLARKGGVIGIYGLSYLVPFPQQPNLDDYLAHMTHALDICGEDHVGIGTDGYILPNDTSPAGLKALRRENERRETSGVAAPGEGPLNFVLGLDGPDRYAVIMDALKRKGYSARVVDKVLGENFLRIFRETWLS